MDYNELGLISNIIGSFMLFVFGSPFKFTKEYGIIYKSPTSNEKLVEKITKILSSLGMALVFIGFGLQYYHHNKTYILGQVNNTQPLIVANYILTLFLLVLVIIVLIRKNEI
ncbi:hypothetical protein D1164_04525 [Mariniphaga sediminis]|uniref:DUF3784 domain-containing protein n=1 Tax=Mariniphaga sediminis TaxID=1628158 RepID=A0A399D616_9BACT|nr:hypothetical protein [Mariniphaga sediminis]RIH66181.1 hypothetical protein D1164_04525 [Mariniphaga sediminis]